jgi:hypothetical protein
MSESTISNDERTPLIKTFDDSKPGRTILSPIRRVLFTALISAASFAFTQTSLIYAFRVMTCDDYFERSTGHQDRGDTGDISLMSKDRCSIPVVESRTAQAIAIMSTMTTFCCTSFLRLPVHQPPSITLTLSNPKPLRDRILVQETGYQNRHDPTNILGRPSLLDADIRLIHRGQVWYHDDHYHADYQCSRIGRGV